MGRKRCVDMTTGRYVAKLKWKIKRNVSLRGVIQLNNTIAIIHTSESLYQYICESSIHDSRSKYMKRITFRRTFHFFMKPVIYRNHSRIPYPVPYTLKLLHRSRPNNIKKIHKFHFRPNNIKCTTQTFTRPN